MESAFIINGKKLSVNFSEPIDISLPLVAGEECVNAFYLNPPSYEAVRAGSFVGSVSEGGSCNCETITLAPHGNGTHTECVGHISRERVNINDCLKQFMFVVQVLSVEPEILPDGDCVITREQITIGMKISVEALALRTLPNEAGKIEKKYSGTNPAYLLPETAEFLRDNGVQHILLDLPSVDREDDAGRLSAHHLFWDYPDNPRFDSTITEMIFIPDSVPDGLYLLNLQIISVESDASPSKPILYKLLPK